MPRQSWDETRWDDGYVGAGRFFVYMPQHPGATVKGRVLRYQAVWYIRTGRVPPYGYEIHHKDLNPLNDVFENLEVLSVQEHRRLHHGTVIVTLTCKNAKCGRTFERFASSLLRKGRGNYCSAACADEAHSGPPPHGAHSRYNTWGCRCSLCKAASVAYRKARRLHDEWSKW